MELSQCLRVQESEHCCFVLRYAPSSSLAKKLIESGTSAVQFMIGNLLYLIAYR